MVFSLKQSHWLETLQKFIQIRKLKFVVGSREQLVLNGFQSFIAHAFFSSYSLPKPQAAKLKSSINNVRGDLLEKQFYESIKSYFETQNENVLVIHSHKLLGLKSNAQKEKDFIVVNLSFGYILNIEVKCSASGSNLNKALEQIKSTKEELGNWFGLAGRWKFYGAIGCESHNQKGQCKERHCAPFIIEGAENVHKLFELLRDPDFILDDQHLHEFRLISSYLLFFATASPSPISSQFISQLSDLISKAGR